MLKLALPVWLNPAALLMALAAGVLGYGAGRIHQWDIDADAAELAQVQAALDAKTKEVELKDEHRKVADTLKTELAAAVARGDTLAAELRKRPGRLPAASRPACQGATGAELSAADGEFLARYATRAAEAVAELRACEDRERKTYEALTGKTLQD